MCHNNNNQITPREIKTLKYQVFKYLNIQEYIYKNTYLILKHMLNLLQNRLK